MSKSVYIEYKNDIFCTYDISIKIFLILFIKEAEKFLKIKEKNSWIKDLIKIVLSDYVIDLNSVISEENKELFLKITKQIVEELKNKEFIYCEELENKKSTYCEELEKINKENNVNLDFRNHKKFPTKTITELTDAIEKLLRWEISHMPQNAWWFLWNPQLT